jgi:hypothetical protein
VRAVLILALAATGACGGATPQQHPPPVEPEEPMFAEGAHMSRFHSARFSLSVPFPDGPHWRIEDHRTALLRATHEATQSKIEIVLWHEQELMNRQKCEDRAREKGYGERVGEEVTSEIASVPQGWDTLVWLGTENERDVSTGHIVAFAASIRRCLYFHFSTKAVTRAISDRLAFVRLRLLGDIQLDTFEVPRERPPH